MRTYQLFFGVLSLAVMSMISSCKKDKEASGSHSKIISETPIQNMIIEKYVVDTFGTFEDNSYENGLQITFKKKGNITKLGCYMPTAGKYSVTLWDYSSKQILAATTIQNTDPTKFAYKAITPIEVYPEIYYIISVNNHSDGFTQPYYYFYKKSNQNNSSIYPFTTGNVICKANVVRPTESTLYPNNLSFHPFRLYGIADLVYEYEK